MRFVLFPLFLALSYWCTIVLPRKYTGKNFLAKASIVFSLVFFIIPITSKLLFGKTPLVLPHILDATFSSITILVIVLFMSQIAGYFNERIIQDLINNNFSNTHKQPLRFFIENKETQKELYTYFFLFASFLMLYGVWFIK